MYVVLWKILSCFGKSTMANNNNNYLYLDTIKSGGIAPFKGVYSNNT